jgi:hypothetical protein
VVRDDGRGWPGAYWSSGLFVTDAWAISRRRTTELSRPTAAWARRLEWPEPIARWSRTTGELVVFDDTLGQRAERYLGVVYDPARWQSLAPDAVVTAILATAFCPPTADTAAQALSNADPHVLAHFSASDLRALVRHSDRKVREAAERIHPPPGRRVAAR